MERVSMKAMMYLPGGLIKYLLDRKYEDMEFYKQTETADNTNIEDS